MRIPALFFGSFFVPIGLLWVYPSSQDDSDTKKAGMAGLPKLSYTGLCPLLVPGYLGLVRLLTFQSFRNHVITGAYQEWWPRCVSQPYYFPKFILITSSLPIQLYLVDSFVYAASAVSASSVSRLSLFYSYEFTESRQPAFSLAARVCFSLIRPTNVRYSWAWGR